MSTYFSLETAAQQVLVTLEHAGFEAYIVGGCVRDQFLYRTPKDYDVVTNARPEQISALFEKTIEVGARFGVVIAVLDAVDKPGAFQIEIATYRADGAYTDGRRPDTVTYAESVEEDVSRRDFTINGLVAKVAGSGIWPHVKDYVGGQRDIKLRIIRTIGDAYVRFAEDPLRMLRAVRLAAQLRFQIDRLTFDAIQDNAHLIAKVSRERVRDELVKLLQSDDPGEGITLLMRSGLVSTAIPWLWHANVKGLLRVLEQVKVKPNRSAGFMLGCLMETMPPWARADGIESLKLSNDDVEMIESIFDWPSLQMFRSDYGNARHTLKRAMRVKYFDERCAVYTAYALSGDVVGMKIHDDIMQHIAALRSEGLYPEKLIDGNEVKALGFEGPLIRHALHLVEDGQLDGRIGTKAEAIRFLERQANGK